MHESKKKDFILNPKKFIVIKTEIFEAFNEPYPMTPEELARLIMKHPESILINEPGGEDEHFVIMLRDVHARQGLIGYARSAFWAGQKLLASSVQSLAERSGSLNPFMKFPD